MIQTFLNVFAGIIIGFSASVVEVEQVGQVCAKVLHGADMVPGPITLLVSYRDGTASM